jgi:hypothetical protein
VVAAFGIRRLVDKKGIAGALGAVSIFDDSGFLVTAVLGVERRGIANGLGEGRADVVTNVGKDQGVCVTCSTDLFLNKSPPTISM